MDRSSITNNKQNNEITYKDLENQLNQITSTPNSQNQPQNVYLNDQLPEYTKYPFSVKSNESTTLKKQNTKSHKKKTNSKKKRKQKMEKAKKKVYLATSARQALWFFLTGLISFIAVLLFGVISYYILTQGTVKKGGYCMIDENCQQKTHLLCIQSKCSCSNGKIWHMNQCVPVTSTITTNSAINDAISLFSGSPYDKISINNFSGTPLDDPSDVIAIYIPSIHYLVVDYGNHAAILYDEIGNYVKHVHIEDPDYVTYFDGSYYITSSSQAAEGYIHKYNLNSELLTSHYIGDRVNLNGITFSKELNFMYVCDTLNNLVRAYDSDFNYNSFRSIPLLGAKAISSYKGYLYVGTTENSIKIYKERHLKNKYLNICTTGYMHNLYIHIDSGYLLISCHLDKKVYLWYTNGSHASSTDRFIETDGYPKGIAIDSIAGRIIVSMLRSSRVDILSLKQAF